VSERELTTTEVRGHYAWKSASIVGALDYSEGKAEFDDWFDKHDAEVAATERARIINHLSSSPMVTIAGKGGALEWLRKEAA